MGMFDSIKMNIKCPFCGKVTKNMEIQTKELDCCLEIFRVGDSIPKEYNHLSQLSCIGDCVSDKCKHEIVFPNGMKSTRGNYFTIEVEVSSGIITDRYKIIE